jgi:hypothetical protein
LDVYPNPARQFFTVRLAGQTFTISVYNTQGIEVFNKKGCFGTVDIEAAFAPGIYYLKAISDEGSVAIRSLLVTE